MRGMHSYRLAAGIILVGLPAAPSPYMATFYSLNPHLSRFLCFPSPVVCCHLLRSRAILGVQCKVAPGACDVAYFLSQSMSPHERRRCEKDVVVAYWCELTARRAAAIERQRQQQPSHFCCERM